MSVAGVSPGSGVTPRAVQPVAIYDPTTGAPIAAGVNTDGSQDIAGVDGTSRASATNPLPSRTYGSASFATGQVAIGTTATQIVPARTGRVAVTVILNGAADVFLGVAGVTTANGVLLLGVKGSSVTIPTQAAVFGVSGSTQPVSFVETF